MRDASSLRYMGGLPWVVFLLVVASSGCGPDLGECDETAARAIAYATDGLPSYEGQALVRVSCSTGSFCHSVSALDDARRGVPAGLDFDVNIVEPTFTPGVDAEVVSRLENGVGNIHEWKEDMYAWVEDDTMPPGREGKLIRDQTATFLGFVREDGSALPKVESSAGTQILRNWLACNAPVVERTAPRADGMEPTVGDVVPGR